MAEVISAKLSVVIRIIPEKCVGQKDFSLAKKKAKKKRISKYNCHHYA